MDLAHRGASERMRQQENLEQLAQTGRFTTVTPWLRQSPRYYLGGLSVDDSLGGARLTG